MKSKSAMDNNRLNIVDERGNVIGEETRQKIHRDGLLHRIIHVWFYTPDKRIIFQVRGKDAETNPNLFDATVGGHVEIGQDYIQAAIAETCEETGIHVQSNELQPLAIKKFGPTPDKITNTINHHLVALFAYLFRGEIKNLQAEKDEDGGIKFEAWPIEKIFSLTEEERKRFIPTQLKPDYLEIFRKIILLAGKTTIS